MNQDILTQLGETNRLVYDSYEFLQGWSGIRKSFLKFKIDF